MTLAAMGGAGLVREMTVRTKLSTPLSRAAIVAAIAGPVMILPSSSTFTVRAEAGLAAATVHRSSGTTAAMSVRAGTREVEYLGYAFDVPSLWPVLTLGKGSTVCPRFNRHAVYLGTPSLTAQCPANLVGRTEAILAEPLASASGTATYTSTSGALIADRAGQVAARAWPASTADEVVVDVPSAGVQVIATWQRDPSLIRGILLSARVIKPLSDVIPTRASVVSVPAAPTTQSATPQPAVYTGLGFDMCGMPSAATLTDWHSSPYRAMNLYIGGVNAACPQKPTSTWVKSVTALGWHIIPTYVGLQAPQNDCKCASISTNTTTDYQQGLAAATDAISELKVAGIGPENPIYYDMEGYTPGYSNSAYVLSFLNGWTRELHASKYLSGVYSDAWSGMTDLAVWYPATTSYASPNDIWFADWNGVKSTALSTIPSSEWASHQRIHQFNGGVNVTYGGVTMNIDGDYCDGQVVATSSL
jgi:hypothetical protein